MTRDEIVGMSPDQLAKALHEVEEQKRKVNNIVFARQHDIKELEHLKTQLAEAKKAYKGLDYLYNSMKKDLARAEARIAKLTEALRQLRAYEEVRRDCGSEVYNRRTIKIVTTALDQKGPNNG